MNENKHANRSGILKIILLCLILAGIAVFLLYWFLLRPRKSADTWSDLVVTNLDVGKADCAILQYKDITGIIDTGTEDAFDTIDSFLIDNEIDSFDYMILTHYDKDHIGSAVKLLEKYPTGSIYIPDYVSKKKYYPGLMEELEKQDNVVVVNMDPVDFQYDDLRIEVIPAEYPAPLLLDDDNRDNNMSLLSMVGFGENKLLFTGDIEGDRITQIVDSGEDLDADWIKIPHHGGYEEELDELLDMVSPQDAVISTSHEKEPKKKLLETLTEDGIHTYDTMDSNVVTICDGKNLFVEAQ